LFFWLVTISKPVETGYNHFKQVWVGYKPDLSCTQTRCIQRISDNITKISVIRLALVQTGYNRF